MREVEDADLAAYSDGKWQITLFAQWTLQIYEQYRSQLADLADAAPITDALSPESPVTCDFLIGADTYQADPAVPDEVVQVLLESVADATHVRGFTPMAISAYVDQFYSQSTTGDEYQLELILPMDVFERIYTRYPDQTEEALRDTHVSLRHGPIALSFGLWIADSSHAGIIVYAEHGVQGLVINDTDAALEWAENQYERIQQDAQPIAFRGGR
jgi:predicted transcriptional regulator